MTTVYQQAAQFIGMGIGICPIPYRCKIPVQPWQIYETHMPTEQELRGWFASDLHNYGVVLGWQRLAVLDFDEMDLYYQWQMWSIDNCKLLDDALTVKTARGMHVYFHMLDDVNNTRIPSQAEIDANRDVPADQRVKLPAIDFKVHGYVIGPGSTHPTGAKYTAISPLFFPIIEKLSDIIPDEMLEMSALYNESELTVHAKPPGEGLATPGDLWDEIDQGTMFDVLSPVEKIKRRWKLENFFPGEKQDRQGYLHVCCPFHKDEKPSAWVDTKNQLFGCHSCNMKPMSVIGFYAALHQIDIRQAIKEMMK